MTPPVEPALFQRVIDYAALIAGHKIGREDYVKKTTGIVIFCQSFFEQFSKNVLGDTLVAFDDRAKARAVGLRLDLGDAEPEKQRLLAEFETLCELWDGALGFDYDSSTEDIVEFHQHYIPDLLANIVDWSGTIGFAALTDAASEARDAYNAALPEFKK